MQALSKGLPADAASAADEECAADTVRGAAVDKGGDVENFVSGLLGQDFMEGQGLDGSEDEAVEDEEEEDSEEGTGKWTSDRLDKPLHKHTEVTVRELVGR